MTEHSLIVGLIYVDLLLVMAIMTFKCVTCSQVLKKRHLSDGVSTGKHLTGLLTTASRNKSESIMRCTAARRQSTSGSVVF